jgi:RecA/RadA recombinase
MNLKRNMMAHATAPQPDDGPMALEIVGALVRCGAFDLIVLESAPGLYSPRGDDQASDGAGKAVARARLLRDSSKSRSSRLVSCQATVRIACRSTPASPT